MTNHVNIKTTEFIFCWFKNKYLQNCKYLFLPVIKVAKNIFIIFKPNMINFYGVNNRVAFKTRKKKQDIENPSRSNSFPRILLSTVGMALCLNTISPANSDTFIRENSNDSIESIITPNNKTRLTNEELKAAPSPIINIAGKEKNVGIIVDTKTNKLYRYDNSGEVIDGYHVATGKLNSNGKSLTTTGIRRVHHIEDYPYSKAYGTKRKANPKPYGPNVLYLTIINPKTGVEEPSNGEFIHGNNDASSIGKYKSGGCIRMDNDVIKQFADEVKVGTLVLIK